jgi:hypothetical protein
MVSFTIAWGEIDELTRRAETLALRTPRLESSVTPSIADGALVNVMTVETGVGKVTVFRLGGGGVDGLLPVGADWPAEGQVWLSPALESLRSDPLLQALTPGQVVGVIGREALSDPDELLGYVGVRADELAALPGTGRLVGFGVSVSLIEASGYEVVTQAQAALLRLLSLLLVGLAASVLAATVGRLASPARRKRLSSLVLLGASPRALRRVIVVMAALPGLVGAAVGLAVAPGVAAVVSQIRWLEVRSWPHYGWPDPAGLILVAAMTTVVMILAAVLTVPLEPWAVRRDAGPAKTSRLRWLPLLAGLLLIGLDYFLAWRQPYPRMLLAGDNIWLLVLSAGLVIGGAVLMSGRLIRSVSRLAGVGPWLIRLASARAAHRVLALSGTAANLIVVTVMTGIALGTVSALLAETGPISPATIDFTLTNGETAAGRRAIEVALTQHKPDHVEAMGSEGFRPVTNVEDLRPNDRAYALTLPILDADRIASLALPQGIPNAADVASFHRNSGAVLKERLMAASVMINLCSAAVLVLIGLCTAMLALQEEHRLSDHALMRIGLRWTQLAAVRGVEVIIATLPIGLLAAAVAIVFAGAFGRAAPGQPATWFLPLASLLVVPLAGSLLISSIAALLGPGKRSIPLRQC